LEEVWIKVFYVNLLLLKQLYDLLELIFRDLLKILGLLFIILLRDDLLLELLSDNIHLNLLCLLPACTLRPLSSFRSFLTLLLRALEVSSILHHSHLLLLLHQSQLMLVLLQVDDVTVPLTVLDLHVVLALMMTQILSPIIIIFMELMLVILNLLTSSNDLVLLSGPSKPGILKDHFLAVDVLDRLGFLPVHLGHLVHLLLLHEVLNQLLGEGELARVLVILLLEVLKQHLAVLVIKLVEVDHHFFVLFTLLAFIFLVFLIVIMLLLVLLVLASLLSSLVARTLGLLLKLELLKLLGDVNIQFFFLLVLIVFLVVMIFHQLGLLLLKKASCAAFLLVLLLHHLLLELDALEDGRGIGLAW
jgi:hypothetical protein